MTIEDGTKHLMAEAFQVHWSDSTSVSSYLEVFIIVFSLEINDHHPLKSLKPETSVLFFLSTFAKVLNFP